MEYLHKFHLDLCSPIYSNYPQVFYLGMNLGRGWNPNLEGSYLLEYSESEAEFWTHVHQEYIFGLYNFQLLNLFQYWDIANIPKLSSFNI